MNFVKGILMLAVVALTTNTWATSLTVKSSPNTVKGVWVNTEESEPGASDYTTSKTESKKVVWPWKADFWAYYKTSNEEWNFLGWYANAEGSGTAKSTSCPYKYSISAGDDETIYGVFHVHNFIYVASDMTITRQCDNADSKCKGGYTAKTATLVAADSKAYDGEAYVATKTGTGAADATITYWQGATKIDSAVEAGDYTVKMTYGTAEVSKPFSIIAHAHNFKCTVAEGKLTVECQNSGCTIPDGTSLEIVCTGNKTYDGTALTATIKDNTPSPDTFESYTGGTRDAEVTWDDATANAGNHTASFKATVAGKEYTISKTFTIAQKDISGATFELDNTTFDYTDEMRTVNVKALTADGMTVDGYSKSGVWSAQYVGTYEVTVTGTGNFCGSKSTTWTIKTPTKSITGAAAADVTGYGTVTDKKLSVSNSTNLIWKGNNTWAAGITLTWPIDERHNDTWDFTQGWDYTDVAHVRMQLSTTGKVYTGTQIQAGETDGEDLALATGTAEYKKVRLGSTYTCTYVKTTTWRAQFTLEQVTNAIERGETHLTYQMTAFAPIWTGDDYLGNKYGVAPDTYTIEVPLAGITLFDGDGNQVYPDAGYVAQVADTKLKYTTLAEAIGAATADQTVNAIAACEAGTFEVGADVTVNLGGFGNAEASYKFVNVTDEAMSAKVVSTKEENVTTEVTGFAVNNDNYTYTLYRAHLHLWEAATSGATLTASCTNMTTDCDIAGRQTAITLTVTGGSDGVAPTFTIDNQEDFLKKVNKFSEVAVIGDVTAVRTTDDGAETTKWYIGNYTASCIVTVNGEEKTMTQDFSIGGELKAGGYVVASRNIRYGSFAEALAAAEDGDTIYYRNGDIGDQSVTFSVDKDVTLDFGGAAFAYKGNSDANFYNNGSGTLTLKNVELKQPRYSPTVGSRKYHNITFYGAFVFSDGVKGVETDNNYEDLLTINAVNGSIKVQAGLYQCAFAAGDNGSVSITGGEFWSYFDPAGTEYVADGYVTVAATTEGYTYKVVPHEHDFYYETEGNVITLKCQGEGYEGCAWTLNENKLTLTASDAFEGTTYTGATYEPLDENFLYDGTTKPEIEYYKDNVKVGTPSTFGDYEARVTVTINGSTATAVKAFTIKHVHQFKYDIAPSETLTATCTNIVSTCDIPDHTTAITLSVTDNGDGVAPTFEIANKDAFLAYVNRDATVATIGEITTVRNTDDGAAVSRWYVGNYRSTCVVTISGVAYTLTKDFSIAKPEGGYTSGWEVGSTGIRYLEADLYIVYATAADGDTIYYRDPDRKNETHEYSDNGKKLTFDFGGHTLTKDAYKTMTIKNSGSGILTLQNVVIKQPRGTWSGQIKTEGNIVFGEGVKVVNTAEDSGNYCTITVNSGALIVSNGCYQCGFDTDGGTVKLEGGKYWQYDKPVIGQYNVADHVCIEIEGDYKYEIVEHSHHFAYTAEGNVITSVCDGEYKEGCYWYQNPQTATLTANDVVESSEPYSGASVAYTEVWVGDKPAIAYSNVVEQLEGAPTKFGDYWASITVQGATAYAAFTIRLNTTDPAKTNEIAYVTTNGVSEIKIPSSFITNVVEDAANKSATEITVELNKDGANGISKIESYVLGLDPKTETSVPVTVPVQTSQADKLTLKVGNINVKTNVGATVKYRMETADSPDFSDAKAGAQQDTGTFSVDLPESGVKYYRIKIDVQ